MPLTRLADALDHAMARLMALGRWLVLPLVALLFLQWPLREWVAAGSREANDLGQVLFALVVALGITAATRDGAHLTADAAARAYPPARRRLIARLGAALVSVPFGAYVLAAGGPGMVESARVLERFGETGDPGYFLVRLAVGLLAGLMVLQGLLDLARPRGGEEA